MFPEEGIFPFWMKNTYLPLDSIWTDAQGTVVEVQRSELCEECKLLTPAGKAQHVLEVSAGSGIQIREKAVITTGLTWWE